MKSVTFQIALVIGLALILLLAPATASAQETLPTAVTQVHTYQWEWGYVSMQPLFGFWLGDRFLKSDLVSPVGGWDPDINGDPIFTQEPLFGAKMAIGFGSNVDWVGTEFYFTILRDGYHGTTGGNDVTIDQWSAKFGFHILVELVSNEAINDAGEITKDANIGITFIGGFYVSFFPDSTFDLRRGSLIDDIQITDETLWTSLAMYIDIPIGDHLTITGYSQLQFLTYRLERLELLSGLVGPEQDRGDWNVERFAERVQFHFGGIVTFTPHFNTFDDHHWRLFGGVTFSKLEGSQPSALIFSAGVNFGW